MRKFENSIKSLWQDIRRSAASRRDVRRGERTFFNGNETTQTRYQMHENIIRRSLRLIGLYRKHDG
jgi:hypothetical protein